MVRILFEPDRHLNGAINLSFGLLDRTSHTNFFLHLLMHIVFNCCYLTHGSSFQFVFHIFPSYAEKINWNPYVFLRNN
jgi:hypothetical protein